MMFLGFLLLLLAVWYWMRSHDRKGSKISALLLAVVGLTVISNFNLFRSVDRCAEWRHISIFYFYKTPKNNI